MDSVASRYGNALYSLAEEKGKVVSWKEEMKSIRDIFIENPEFISILSSAFLSHKNKNEKLDIVFKEIDDEILSFMKIIIENNRVNYLLDAINSFISYCNDALGIKEGIIFSTIPLEKELINKITKKISEIESVEIYLTNKIDPSLIGGIKVVINDHVYDGSIKNQLESLKSNLL